MHAIQYQKELDKLFEQVHDLWCRASETAELVEYPDMADAIDQLAWALVAISESARLNLKRRSDFELLMRHTTRKPIEEVRELQTYWRAWAAEQYLETIDKTDTRALFPPARSDDSSKGYVEPAVLDKYMTDKMFKMLDAISENRDERVLAELICAVRRANGRTVWRGTGNSRSPGICFMTELEKNAYNDFIRAGERQKAHNHALWINPRPYVAENPPDELHEVDPELAEALSGAIWCSPDYF